MEPVLRLEALTKDYGQNRGAFDVHLQVHAGTIHGFIGPNGAGKTTTIRMILDLLRPTSGNAYLFGTHASEASIRKRIGYVPGELHLPDSLHARDYLSSLAKLQGGDTQASLRRMVELAGILELDLDRKIRTLSKGNKQKVALVQALQHQPQLLLLDEPTDGLDPVLRRRLHKLLRAHCARGGTVFLSSHVIAEIEDLCDTITIIAQGRIVRWIDLRKEPANRMVLTFHGTAPTTQLRAELEQDPTCKKFRVRGEELQLVVVDDWAPLVGLLARAGYTLRSAKPIRLEDQIAPIFASSHHEVSA